MVRPSSQLQAYGVFLLPIELLPGHRHSCRRSEISYVDRWGGPRLMGEAARVFYQAGGSGPSPAVAGDVVYMGSGDGYVYALLVSP